MVPLNVPNRFLVNLYNSFDSENIIVDTRVISSIILCFVYPTIIEQDKLVYMLLFFFEISRQR